MPQKKHKVLLILFLAVTLTGCNAFSNLLGRRAGYINPDSQQINQPKDDAKDEKSPY